MRAFRTGLLAGLAAAFTDTGKIFAGEVDQLLADRAYRMLVCTVLAATTFRHVEVCGIVPSGFEGGL
jgi:hypothetical protein